MIKLATTIDIINSILINRQHQWHDLLFSQPISTLFLLDNGNVKPLESDPLWIWTNGHNIEVLSSEESTLCIKSEKRVKEYNALYLLEISDEEALDISKNTGVVCLSVSSDATGILKYANSANTFEKINGKYKWNDWTSIFEKRYHGPSNSLIIVDRWFFNSEKKGKDYLIRFNLLNILDSILPKYDLSCQYQILMLFEKPIQIKDYKSWSLTTINIIKYVIDELRKFRSYEIIFEAIININTSVDLREFTHNRIMLTNYSYVGSQEEWKIFDKNGPQKESDLRFEELLYVNEDQKASANIETKISMICQFINAFLESYVKHIQKQDLCSFKYAWLINDKIYTLIQESNGQSSRIDEIDSTGNVKSYELNRRMIIQNRIIKSLLPKYD